MKTSTVNYPWPTLTSEGNDFPGSSFSIEVQCGTSKSGQIVISVQFTLDCPGIEELIKCGDAVAIVKLECPSSGFRIIKTATQLDAVTIYVDEQCLAKMFNVRSEIVSARDSSHYLPQGANDEFFTNEFTISRGAIIGVTKTERYYLDTAHKHAVSSIVTIALDQNQVVPLDANFDQDKIRILLNSETYQRYDQLRLDPSAKRYLIGIITYPIIINALYLLATDEDDQFSDLEWARVISEKLEQKGYALESELCLSKVANDLLGDIVGRALNGIESLVSGPEGDELEGVI